MTPAAPRILELLTYIEQVEKLKSTPAFTVPSAYFVAHQHELHGLPDLAFDVDADDGEVWLRIPRLKEVPVPAPSADLAPWITLGKDPGQKPQLNSSRVLVPAAGLIKLVEETLAERPEIKVRFAEYVAQDWMPWARAETPRRQTIARYNALFALQQSLSSDTMDSPLELVWGMGAAAWAHPAAPTPLQHPLIVQACEVHLDPATFDIDVRPRDVDPRLELDPYSELELPGVRHLDALWAGVLANGAARPTPFVATSFDSVLKAAVGHLDPTGSYEARTGDFTPPTPGPSLIVTNTWVLFARKRSADVYLDDIRRLKAKVEAATSLPAVVCSFVEEGDATVRARPEQAFRGLSNSDGGSGAFELYFPLPYNDEQVSIIQKLEHNEGVVVQGPPGTGKTHTIANVISHYLANGKRVLVTSKGESALAVLQDKLPPRIRPLSVALLSDERDGMKQFEHSVQTIAASVAALNPARAESAIAQGAAQLDQLHAQISHVDRAIAQYADQHMRSYTYGGKEVSPAQMAQLVQAAQDEHDWFDDTPPATPDGALPFDAADIGVLRQARIRVGADLPYLATSLPSPGAFPAWPALAVIHRDLVKARAIDARVAAGGVLALIDTRPDTLEQARQLQDLVAQRIALRAKLIAANEPWIDPLGPRLAALAPDDTLGEALQQVCAEFVTLEAQRRVLLANAVQVPDGAEKDEDVTDALARLVAGKSAFVLPFGKGAARALIAAVTVLGAAPAGSAEWALVRDMLEWRVQARKALVRWSAIAREFEIEPAGAELEPAFRRVLQLRGHVQDVFRLVFELDTPIPDQVQAVFGRDAMQQLLALGEAYFETIAASLEAQADQRRLADAVTGLHGLRARLDARSGGIVAALDAFLADAIGRAAGDEAVLQTTWQALVAELTRLVELRPAFDDIARIAHTLDAAGAVHWAARARTVPAGEGDPVVPATWPDAWHWRQAVMFLDSIDGHGALRGLFEERRSLTALLARTYQDLIAEKTWLGVYNNSPDNVRQALQSYLTAVQSMGAGTGVRAIRHRQTARKSMLRAYQAVPCWVLPHWRVSETLPADIGMFDLVVIDEASQSDIWALPALLRGKKLLVVGDHKQVSPSAVGAAEEKIKELSARFLANQPHGAQMTPDQSIYDLARVVFAGNSVMLKEHFRCVPAIIEYANREFYEGEIRPLRLPKANERLDPPLIDIFVKGGVRKGDTNPAEALAIVNEIEAILQDETLDGRSLGVVTLLGTAQAALIHELISKRIAPADVLARRIAVGPPPLFQGRERDIMMISMVLGPTDRAAANKADMRQRFNVALSRARDRMYLFRSVDEATFKEDTLNARLIRHFRQPFRHEVRQVAVLRDACESGFERAMFDELVGRGYRVQPQVACGGYFIDFVVEGEEGRRLAIECDGDRYHGPGQWPADMARQRVLERAGWTFWRCFASSFVRRRAEVLADLVGTLDGLGIRPLGAEAVDNTVWVASREVDPLGVDVTQSP